MRDVWLVKTSVSSTTHRAQTQKPVHFPPSHFPVSVVQFPTTMTDLITSFGYIGLFILSFLASSLLPMSSEVALLAMLPLGYNVWGVTLVATAGNYCGALTNYYVGKWGADFFLSRYITIKPETWAKATAFYQRWGRIALFFSWVPIIGDPLTAVAGALDVNLRTFTFWVVLGKFLRYVVLLVIVQQVVTLW